MNKKTKRKLKRYITPYMNSCFAGIVLLLIGVLCVTAALSKELSLIYDETDRLKEVLQGIVFTVLIGGGFTAFSIKKLADFHRYFAQTEQSGEMEQMLTDFENGKRAFKKTVIIGDKYIFGKHSGQIIKIDDIARVYQYIEKDAMGEKLRRLRIVSERGQKTDLGKVPLLGKGNSEMEEVFELLKEKNSFIMFGFVRDQ